MKAEEFSISVVDDISALRKRVKLKELILFETTLVTHEIQDDAKRKGVAKLTIADIDAEMVAARWTRGRVRRRRG